MQNKKRSSLNQAPFWRKLYNSPAFRFVLGFILYLVILGFSYSQLFSRSEKLRNGFTNLTAQVVGTCYSLTGSKASVAGSLITAPGVSISVIEECTGAYEMIIFAGAVLAFPARRLKKLWGILFGLPLLFIINIIRMWLLAFVQAHGSHQLFEFMHVYFWQATLILMILGVFILWIKLFVYRNVQTV